MTGKGRRWEWEQALGGNGAVQERPRGFTASVDRRTHGQGHMDSNRDTQRETGHTDRGTYGQGQMDRDTQRETGTHGDIDIHGHGHRHGYTDTDKQIHGQIQTRTHGHTDRWTQRHGHGHMCTHGHTEEHTDTQMWTHRHGHTDTLKCHEGLSPVSKATQH